MTATGLNLAGDLVTISHETDPITIVAGAPPEGGDEEIERELILGDLLPTSWPETPQPASYSDDDSHPADRFTLPIARWNVIPMQVIPSGGFNIGVVAFHANGIDRVEFEANGGQTTTINRMTVNPRTGNREFWVNLEVPEDNDDLIEIRAIVYPESQGTPFVLQNTPTDSGHTDYLGNSQHLTKRVNNLEYDASNAQDGSDIRPAGPTVISEGEHSMFLWGPNKYSDAPTIYVTPSTGSSAGPGTIDEPYDTLKNAWNDNKTDLNNATIILTEPGDYDLNGLNNATNQSTNESWLIIEGGADLDQKNEDRQVILFSSQSSNEETVPFKFLHFKNVCFESTRIKHLTQDHNDAYFWFDDSYFPDADGREGTAPRGAHGLVNTNQRPGARYVTDCSFFNRRKSSGGCAIVRNTEFVRGANTDVYSNSSMVLDCNVDDMIRTDDSDAHMDVWQLTGGNFVYPMMRNKICFGLRSWNNSHMQPMILDQTRSEFDRIAVVDYGCEWTDGGPEGINLESVTNHLFMSNCSFNQFIKADGVYTNSSIQNTTFRKWEGTAGFFSVPSGMWVRNCLNSNTNSLVGEGTNDTGMWENVIRGNFTLLYKQSLGEFEQSGPGWDQASELGGIPMIGFQDNPPIGALGIP